MTAGTPNFVASRLQEARLARYLTVPSLAEMIGVSAPTIYYFEDEKRTPSPEIFEKLCTCLNFPASFFTRDDLPEPSDGLYMRSLSSASKPARKRASIRHLWVGSIVESLEKRIQFPQLNLPRWDVPPYLDLTDDQIEGFAARLRQLWGLGDDPISNVVWLLEQNGIIVARSTMIHPGLDAMSGWPRNLDRPIILLGTDKASAVRSRFDAAHELGHLVLHRNVPFDVLSKEVVGYRKIEEQAHRFASAFLFPRERFLRETFLVKLDALRAIKGTWLVSIGMMINRAHDLGLINDMGRTTLFKNYTRRGWRAHEPLDDRLPFEEPHLLYDAIRSLVSKGVLTRGVIRDSFRLPRTDVEQLCNLGENYLLDSPPESNVIEMNYEVNEFDEEEKDDD